MKALQLTAHGTPGQFELREVAQRAPGPDEAVVRVAACGLNHLDLWHEEGALPMNIALPRTPGCEIAGHLEALGDAVRDWTVGETVAVQSNLFCGDCEFCRRGEESLCLRGELLGVQRDGGLAELVIVPARALVRVPPGVDCEASAALTLAGSTAMHMLTRRASVTPGSWVLVIGGASGVGSAAIQIARELGARVISTGSTAAKRSLAVKLGAALAVDTADAGWTTAIRHATDKRGVDLVAEHVGGEVLVRCFECLARGGTIVTCGATAGRDVSLNLWPLFVKEQQLVGSYGRSRADITATLDWAARGKLRPVMDSILPLARAVEGFAKLRARQALGKILVKPGTYCGSRPT